jgi:hypothetical protein
MARGVARILGWLLLQYTVLSPYIRRLISGAGTGVLLVTSSCG